MVRYNGQTEAYYGCSDPSCLIEGRQYEVIYKHASAWQTNYVLRGVEGEFNSVWFDDCTSEASELPVVFLATGKNIPVEGKRLECSRIEVRNGRNEFVDVVTNRVTTILQLGRNVWSAKTTSGTVYIVTIV